MQSQDILRIFEETGALLNGHFILRSGLRSRQYFQCAMMLQYPDKASLICEALAEKLRSVECDSVVSPALGGILVGHEVASRLGKRHIFVEKEEGVLKLRRFEVRKPERFLVVEDVVTTGGAVMDTCNIIRSHGGEVVAVASIVDRSGERKPDFGAPFTSLLEMKVETFSPDELPEDLQAIPPVKPGSSKPVSA